VARLGINAFLPFVFPSYSLMDVSQPQCTSNSLIHAYHTGIQLYTEVAVIVGSNYFFFLKTRMVTHIPV
jgi:hypothetical protein